MEKMFVVNGKKINVEKLDAILKAFNEVLSSFQPSEVTKEELKENTEPSSPMELEYYIGKLAHKKGWKWEKMAGFLDSIDDINPVAAYNMVLKEIAIELDKKYKDNIRNSEHIFCISLIAEKIVEVPKSEIKHWNTFAAFRSVEDAQLALDITKDLLEEMLNGK